jgi:phosphatidylinositol alpha-1,6-mannosyltransferase
LRHLLVTNDFPPKVGGIQSYLWELWRRLDPSSFSVLTTSHEGGRTFDAEQVFEVHRIRSPVMVPGPWLVRAVRRRAEETGASLVVIDPAVPVGLIGPRLGLPYAVVVHGAEVTVPGHVAGLHRLLGRVLSGASLVVAAGRYVESEVSFATDGRPPPVVLVPPGVDTGRFRPLGAAGRKTARRRLGLPGDGLVVVSVSRLVPRKGMDVLVDATAALSERHPDLFLAVGGEGRDRGRLQRRIARTGAPARLLGRVPDEDLPDLYGCADVFAMVCRDRWGGLEQEGFGIVFLEAAACGVAQLAGASGGAGDAVLDGETGLVVHRPSDVDRVAGALGALLDDDDLRAKMGEVGRRRAVEEFDYDVLARHLADALRSVASPSEVGDS